MSCERSQFFVNHIILLAYPSHLKKALLYKLLKLKKINTNFVRILVIWTWAWRSIHPIFTTWIYLNFFFVYCFLDWFINHITELFSVFRQKMRLINLVTKTLSDSCRTRQALASKFSSFLRAFNIFLILCTRYVKRVGRSY